MSAVTRNHCGALCEVEPLENRLLFSSAIDREIAAVGRQNSAPAVTRALTTAPVLTVGNPDFLPFSDRLIFNTIQKRNATFGDVVHDTNDLLLTNNGGSALVISSINVSANAPWILQTQQHTAPRFPITLAAHQSVSLLVKFVAKSVPIHTTNQTNDKKTTNLVAVNKAGGVWNGTLTIASSDPAARSKVITLAGYDQFETEHENEPSLQTIINLLGGWTTQVAPAPFTPDLTEGSTRVNYGEEVKNSAFWVAADPSKAVLVRHLASFHNEGNASGIYWYPRGASSQRASLIFKSAQLEGQSLLPHLYSATNAPTGFAFGSFKPGTTPFALRLDGESTDDRVNLMGPGKGAGHHVRAYPVRDRNGAIEPNNYFFAIDYSNTIYENYDFQDNVYYVENVKPAG